MLLNYYSTILLDVTKNTLFSDLQSSVYALEVKLICWYKQPNETKRVNSMVTFFC